MFGRTKTYNNNIFLQNITVLHIFYYFKYDTTTNINNIPVVATVKPNLTWLIDILLEQIS